jgi:hypothetical protein
MATEHGFNLNFLPVTIWGTDARGTRFNEEIRTSRIALRAAEIETSHAIPVGAIVGLRYQDRETSFTAVESVILRQDMYRVTLQNLDGPCLWETELLILSPEATKAERRRSGRFGVLGQAMVFQLTGASGIMRPFKLTEITAHGCYIESRTPLPPSAEVSLRLTLSNATLDAHGIVRTAHAGVGMGIEIQRFETTEDEARWAKWLVEAEAASG